MQIIPPELMGNQASGSDSSKKIDRCEFFPSSLTDGESNSFRLLGHYGTQHAAVFWRWPTETMRDGELKFSGFKFSSDYPGKAPEGGARQVEKELARLMDRPIRNHIVVKLEAIGTLADLVGGIELDVPKRLYYVDRSQGLVIDLQPGKQLLKGKELEGFLRWRNDGRGDFGRLERQQLALKALFERIKQPQNLIRLPALIAAAGSQIQTDLGPMELGGLITAIGSTDLETQRLKATPFSRGGVSYLDTEWPAKDSTGVDASEASSRRWRFLF